MSVESVAPCWIAKLRTERFSGWLRTSFTEPKKRVNDVLKSLSLNSPISDSSSE